MNIGIITFQRSVSFGAFFQCLGLVEMLRSLGHSVEVIDYQPPHRQSKIALRLGGRRFGLTRSNFTKFMQRGKFTRAIHRCLPLGSVKYASLEELRLAPPQLDVIICGSDQIWNPSHIEGNLDPAYFGDFGSSGPLRLSYAASFGSSCLESEQIPRFRDLCERLDHISVREEKGVEFAARATGRRCLQVPDPTILYRDFGRFTREPRQDGRYVLSFRLFRSAAYDQALDELVENCGHPLIHIEDGFGVRAKVSKRVIPSPMEWLGWISRAEHVVTNSFHGIVFCLLFNRPFTAVALSGTYANRNERIVSLLARYGLSDLIYEGGDGLHSKLDKAGAIDWSFVNEMLDQESGNGRKFLIEALSSRRPTDAGTQAAVA